MTTFKFDDSMDSYGRCFTVEVDAGTLEQLRAGQEVTVTVKGKIKEVSEEQRRDYKNCEPQPMPAGSGPSEPKQPPLKTFREVKIEMSEVTFPDGSNKVVQTDEDPGEFEEMSEDDYGEESDDDE